MRRGKVCSWRIRKVTVRIGNLKAITVRYRTPDLYMSGIPFILYILYVVKQSIDQLRRYTLIYLGLLIYIDCDPKIPEPFEWL